MMRKINLRPANYLICLLAGALLLNVTIAHAATSTMEIPINVTVNPVCVL